MKDILNKIVYGFLFGLGLSLAVITSAYVYEKFFNENNSDEKRTFSNEAGLVIIDQNKVIRNSTVLILSKIKNQGSDTWQRVIVEAEIFDRNGVFSGECSVSIHEKLHPGESENFDILCNSWKDKNLEDIGEIILKVKGANFVPEKNK